MKTKSHLHRRRWGSPFFVVAMAAVATFLLTQLVVTLIEELPKFIAALK